MAERFEDILQRERDMEQILLSEQDPVSKVKKIMGLGVDEEEAHEIVERYQIGQMAPVYYERLEFDEEDEPLE